MEHSIVGSGTVGATPRPGDRWADDANLSHLRLLVSRRDKIDEAITSTCEAIAQSVKRERVPHCERLLLRDALKDLQSAYRKAPSTIVWAQLDDGCPSPSKLCACDECDPTPIGRQWRGLFPPPHRGRGVYPSRRRPVVYALFRDSTCVYVGKTRNLKARLSTHWTDDRKPGLSSWLAMYVGPDYDRIEMEEIGNLNPEFNVVGRTDRSVR